MEMEVTIRYFVPYKYLVFIDGVKVGTFEPTIRLGDKAKKEVYSFRQSPTVFCISAAQLIVIAKALDTFDPAAYEPENDDNL